MSEVSARAWSTALFEYCPSSAELQSLVTDVALVSSDWLLRTAQATWAWLESINWKYWTNTTLQTARACLQTACQTDPVYILILGLGRLERRNSFICKHSTLELLFKLSPPPSNSILLNAFLFPQFSSSPQQ